LDIFTRSEAAVTETLIILANEERDTDSVKMPHLVGQRYHALATVLASDVSSSGRWNAAAADALSSFHHYDQLRTHVVHGVFSVTLDQSGLWHLTSRLLALRSGREAREVFAASEREGAQIMTSLEKDGTRLRQALGQLRRRLRG
jgi:hypothetical protein